MSEVITETERPTSANGLKRQRSGEGAGEQESKRQRTSPGKNSPIPHVGNVDEVEVHAPKKDVGTEENKSEQQQQQPQDETPQGTRRKAGVMDEKQRSKRLFGSLLGNLNRPSDRASQRRQEIEARRKAELQRQDDERLEEKNRRLERLAEHRRHAQKAVDEENKRIRHAQLLNNANFLQTNSQPKLYYRPWDLRDEEEDRIDQQIKDAKALIARENGEPEPMFVSVTSSPGGKELSQPRSQQKDSPASPDHATYERSAKTEEDSELPHQPDIEGGDRETSTREEPPDPSAEVANSQPDIVASDQPADDAKDVEMGHEDVLDHAVAEQKHADEDGDHVVEGEEDTVIY